MAGQGRWYQPNLLVLSRRTRPGWPLEEGSRRNVDVGATSSCLGVRSLPFCLGWSRSHSTVLLFARNLHIILTILESSPVCRTTAGARVSVAHSTAGLVPLSASLVVCAGCCRHLLSWSWAAIPSQPSPYRFRTAILRSLDPPPRPRRPQSAGSAPCYPRAPRA